LPDFVENIAQIAFPEPQCKRREKTGTEKRGEIKAVRA